MPDTVAVPTDAPGALRPLLEARTVAVVGASARPESVGRLALEQLLGGGHDGPVHPVNPGYDELAGLPCAASLDAVDGPLDLVVLAVGNAQLEAQLTRAAELGAGAAVVFASGHGRAAGGGSLAARLAAIARDAGMALCGANSMGFVNVDRRLWVTGYRQPLDLEPGGVSLLTHSGSLLTALLHNRRRVRFNLAVSTGQELVTTIADHLAYAVRRPTTRVVALFLEAVRDPDRFVDALAEARRRDIAVVALTVGRHAPTRALVTAHSGALAGDDGAYEALFDAHGVHRVRTLEELLDTVALFAAGRRAAPGGIAVLHDSGGERAHLLDLALDAGAPLAELAPATRERLTAVLDPELPATNPLDAWGSSRGFHETFMTCGRALLDDPGTAALAFCVDLPDPEDDDSYPVIARALHAGTDKPVAVLANVPGAVNPVVADRLRLAGVPVLEGATSGLAALGHLVAHRATRARPPATPPPGVAHPAAIRWRDRLTDPAPWSEAEALALLADHGVPTVAHEVATDRARAVAAADRLGYPVVCKAAAPGLAHKTEAGGVRLDLRAPDEVAAAYDDLCGRLGPQVSVAAQVPPGLELALGVVVDPAFGPLVVVAAGGVLAEAFADRRVALAPVDAAGAHRMLDGLAVLARLDGARGRAPVDRDAIADAVVRVSTIAGALGDLLAALDVNPLICRADGCVAVDALIEPAVLGPHVEVHR